VLGFYNTIDCINVIAMEKRNFETVKVNMFLSWLVTS
jgi:hypothetical protein